jgi:hypothetical protein
VLFTSVPSLHSVAKALLPVQLQFAFIAVPYVCGDDLSNANTHDALAGFMVKLSDGVLFQLPTSSRACHL